MVIDLFQIHLFFPGMLDTSGNGNIMLAACGQSNPCYGAENNTFGHISSIHLNNDSFEVTKLQYFFFLPKYLQGDIAGKQKQANNDFIVTIINRLHLMQIYKGFCSLCTIRLKEYQNGI